MSAIAPVVARLAERIAAASGRIGRAVDATSLGVLDRAGHLALAEPGQISANGACRLVRAADGWIAVNLARDEDRELTPAWLELAAASDDTWRAVEAGAAGRRAEELVERATLLGLPAGRVGEVRAASADAPLRRFADGGPRVTALRVLDLSAMWAGPLCGAVLAAAGLDVTRIESLGRPDPTRTATPRFFQALNGAKREVGLDLRTAAGRAALLALVESSDVLITGARPAALARLGLTPARWLGLRPAGVWVAITGYGWGEDALATPATRVAFGDDAAAAGGLVGWTDGEPRFLGDALADPVTGLAAAAGALAAIEAGGGVLVDAGLATSAAGAAAELGFVR